MKTNYKYILLVTLLIFICSLSISLMVLGIEARRGRIADMYAVQPFNDPVDSVFYKTIRAIISPTESNILYLSKELIDSSSLEYAKKWLKKGKSNESKVLLADIYLRQGEYPNALEILNNIYDRDLGNYHKARAYYISGDLEKGDSFLSNLTPSQETCNLAVLAGSDTMTRCRDYYAGNKEILDILSTNDTNRALKYSYNLANINNYPQLSFAILRRIADLGVADRDVYFELGMRYFKEGGYVEAKQSYLSAAALDPYFPQVYEQLLLLAEKSGDLELQKLSQEKLHLLELN